MNKSKFSIKKYKNWILPLNKNMTDYVVRRETKCGMLATETNKRTIIYEEILDNYQIEI